MSGVDGGRPGREVRIVRAIAAFDYGGRWPLIALHALFVAGI
jgi:hypothetical protein